MLIGYSLGRCVNDIVNGVVDYNDVECVIASALITDSTQIKMVMEEYKYQGYITCSIEDATDMGIKLYLSGKLHMPRKWGRRMHQAPVVWFNMLPLEISDHPLVDEAWTNYKAAIKLTEGSSLNKELDDDF